MPSQEILTEFQFFFQVSMTYLSKFVRRVDTQNGRKYVGVRSSTNEFLFFWGGGGWGGKHR